MTDFLEDNPAADLYLAPSEYTLLAPEQIKCQPKSCLIFVGYRNKNIRAKGIRPDSLHLSRTHKQPNRIYDAKGIHPTISSQEQSGRYFILVNNRVRKLSLSECYRFMGFPADFKLVGSKSKCYERVGNSVCVPLIQSVAKQLLVQVFTEQDSLSSEP